MAAAGCPDSWDSWLPSLPWATHDPGVHASAFFFFFFFAKQFTRLLCWPIMPFVGPPQGYFLAQIPRFLLFDGAARITYEYLYNKI
jgi:hypothetical protein